jgi:hypothetical protein
MRGISWLAENGLASRMTLLHVVSKQASKCIVASSRSISRNMKRILCILWRMKSTELHIVTYKKINLKAVEFWRCRNVVKCFSSWKQLPTCFVTRETAIQLWYEEQNQWTDKYKRSTNPLQTICSCIWTYTFPSMCNVYMTLVTEPIRESGLSSSSLMGVRGKPRMYRSLAGLLYRPL